jgi:alkanesulfonate monooxygenase SsuD/methylene tetrahydromethanopterin reductase-like flavin-dependent oxidoreductase (luciferase family)
MDTKTARLRNEAQMNMNNIKWGIYLREPSWSTNQLREYVERVDEQFDYWGIYTNDHLTGFDKSVDGRENYLEAWTFITTVLMWSKRLHAGHTVLCQSFRNPSLLAKMVSSLDILSNGRFELFLGAGWKEDEYLAYGYPFPSPGERLKQTEETVDILRNLFDADITGINLEGQFWSLKNSRNFPKPQTQPFPIHLGGSKPQFIRMAARVADGFNTGSEVNKAIERFQQFDVEVKNSGGDLREKIKSYFGGIFIFQSDEEAVAKAKEILSARQDAAKISPEEFVKNRLWGTPEILADKLRKFLEIDVRFFILRYQSSEGDPLVEFWDEVRPLI